METLEQRLAYGSSLINRRKWGYMSQLYVATTVEEYPDEGEAWVQAFAVAMLGRDFLAAMAYMEGAKQRGLGKRAHGNMYRDIAIALIRARHYSLARVMLDSALALHADESDPNLTPCLQMVEGRLAMGLGNLARARKLLDAAAVQFEALHNSGEADEQWRFNLMMTRMTLANRLGDARAINALRAKIWSDNVRCTKKHLLITTVLSIPGGWRLVRK